MRLVDKRTKLKNSTFGALDVGEVFLDEDKDICIKINDGRALYYIKQNDSWKVTTKDVNNKVNTVKATLTIEDM